MKKTKLMMMAFVAVIAGISLLTTSCSDDDDPVDTIELSKDKLPYAASGTAPQKVDVTTSAKTWKATSDKTWAKVTDVTEGSFSVTVEDNPGDDPRTAIITVTAGNAEPAKVTVTQQGQDMLVVPDDDQELTFKAAASGERTITLTIEDGVEWTAEEKEEYDWVHITMPPPTYAEVQKSFTVKVDEFTGTGTREAVVIVTAGTSAPTEIEIVQMGTGTLKVSTEELEVFAASGAEAQIVEVATGEADYTATMKNAEGWVTIEKAEITKPGQKDSFKVEVLNNTETTERTAVIEVAAGGVTKEVAVKQAGVNSLTVDPSSHNFVAKEAPEKEFSLTTDSDTWDAVIEGENTEWLIMVKDETEPKFKLTATNNETTTQRTASVKVTAGSAETTVAITQEGLNTLEVDKPLIEPEAKDAPDEIVTLTTNAATWDAVIEGGADWFSIEKDPDNPKFTVKSIADNPDTQIREATITVTAGNATPVTVIVKQAAKVNTLSLSPTGITEFAATGYIGQKIVVTTDAADGWILDFDDTSWFSVNEVRDSENSFTVVPKDDNADTSNKREGRITVKAGNAQDIVLDFTQAAATAD